jgi:hypothetical protein
MTSSSLGADFILFKIWLKMCLTVDSGGGVLLLGEHLAEVEVCMVTKFDTMGDIYGRYLLRRKVS